MRTSPNSSGAASVRTEVMGILGVAWYGKFNSNKKH
jgi:hypothetical protein